LQVDPFLSVSAAHEIGENVRQEIHNSHPGIAEVFIHIGMILDSIICHEWLSERVTQWMTSSG
jgi:divalent metal cation (Fe/Co/Zn/Cd) transporter